MKLLVLKKGHTLVTNETVELKEGAAAVLQQMTNVLDVRNEAANLFQQGFSFYAHTNVLDPEAVELGKRILSADELVDDGQYMVMRPMQGG